MPIFEASRDEVSFYSKKLNCVNEADLRIYGDYNSYKAQLFNIQFVKCHDKPGFCKSDEEISEFLRNKYILLFYNQVRFDAKYYGSESIIAESRIKWLNFNT